MSGYQIVQTMSEQSDATQRLMALRTIHDSKKKKTTFGHFMLGFSDFEV